MRISILLLSLFFLYAIACGSSPTTPEFEPVGKTQVRDCTVNADCSLPAGAICVVPRCSDAGECLYIDAVSMYKLLTPEELILTETCRSAPIQACSTTCDDGESCTDDSCVEGACVNAPRAAPTSCTIAAHPQSSAVCVEGACLVPACGSGDDGAPCFIPSAPDKRGVCDAGTCLVE